MGKGIGGCVVDKISERRGKFVGEIEEVKRG